MDATQRWLFDLDGYLVVPDAIEPGLLARLDAALDEVLAEHATEEPARLRTVLELCSLHAAFRELIANPRLLPYLEAWVDPQARLDHDYAHVLSRGFAGGGLHGGGMPYDPSAYYRVDPDGAIRNGLTVVAYNLREVRPGDGGFACVPGSHKSCFAMPPALKDLARAASDRVRAVPAPAGSAIVFTEALTHGTLPWMAAGERRTLFFKYAPPTLSWAARYYDAARFPDLTPRARAMLEAPNARFRHMDRAPGFIAPRDGQPIGA